MFTWYWKTLYTALVILGWLWAISTAAAAVSSKSDLGVVLGIAGVVTASFAAIGLIGLIHRKREKRNEDEKQAVDAGGTGGDRT